MPISSDPPNSIDAVERRLRQAIRGVADQVEALRAEHDRRLTAVENAVSEQRTLLGAILERVNDVREDLREHGRVEIDTRNKLYAVALDAREAKALTAGKAGGIGAGAGAVVVAVVEVARYLLGK